MRALGFAATSGSSLRTIKQTVAELKLDTSHFTGQRRWTDLQLREAIMRAASWADVLRLLDLIDNGESRKIVKAHSVRLGLDVAHLMIAPADGEPGDDAFTTGAQRSMLRVAAPSIATAWFTLRGMSVAVPVEPEVYDLLVTMEDGIQRVQVKSTTRRTRSGTWAVEVGRRPYALDKTAGKAPYDPDSLDYFFIVDGLGRVFVIPSRVLAGRIVITIDSYAQYCVGDASSLLR
jgi:PD-(D/E)XK nuclease superfamily protein